MLRPKDQCASVKVGFRRKTAFSGIPIYRLCVLGVKASRKTQAKQIHGKNTNTNKLTIKHTEKNVYLLEGECVVSVEESEAVSTGLQLSKAVLAVPVFVTAEIVGIKHFEKKNIFRICKHKVGR